MPILDDGWRAWLAENVRRGCSPESMAAAMVNVGFHYNAAIASATLFRNGGNSAIAQGVDLSRYVYDPCPMQEGDVIVACDREIRVTMRREQPQIVVMENVLSAEECDALIEASRERLKRSTTINAYTGKEEVIAERASESFSFQRGETPLCELIERRLAAISHWPIPNGEGLQILHYRLGGHYKPHYDYFPPEEPGSVVQTQYGGQRVATIIMYLNDVDEGGETVFPKADVSVTPRKGSAVYFRYTNQLGQLDPLSWHGGAAVRKGEKWIMTKWLRQGMY